MPDDRTRMSNTSHVERQDDHESSATDVDAFMNLPFAGQGAPVPWRSAWQLPVGFASIVLIVAGFWVIKQGIVLPDPAALLDASDQRIAEGRFDEATRLIEQAVAHVPEEDIALNARLLSTRADLEARRPRMERDNHRVIELYEQVQQMGRPLTTGQESRRAAALAGLGRYEEAFALLLEVESSDAGVGTVQRRVLETLVGEALDGDTELRDQLVPVLDTYAASPERTADDCAWAAVAAARLRLDSGDPGNGLEHLMRAMRRLDVRNDRGAEELAIQSEWLGRMYGTLGRLWLALEDRTAARGALQVAIERLERADEEHVRAQAALAWIEFAEGNYEESIVRFDAVLESGPARSTQLEVTLWKSDAHAAIGAHELAIRGYEDVHAGIPSAVHPIGRRLALSLGDRVRETVFQSDYTNAIMYGELILGSSQLLADDEILAYTADAYRSLGSNLLCGENPAADLHAIPREDVPDADRREASRHYRRAGSLYSDLAGRLEGQPDEQEAWARAQAAAGECFDLGADRGSAIEAYVRFLKTSGPEDMQRARIAFRHARVLHSAHRFDESLAAYDRLIGLHGGGAYAAAAQVGSAHCLVELFRPQEARSRLEAIVSGATGIRPEALEYREAMFTLGSLLYEMEQRPSAVQVLDEAVRRYPEDARVPNAAYYLGCCYKDLAEAEYVRRKSELDSPSERAVRSRQYVQRLERACTAFDIVIASFGDRRSEELDDLQDEMLRVACVSRADAAYELGNYEECVILLEDIERRYRMESTSLDALIRLVEVWDALEEPGKAEKAHRRAELRLRDLPEEAFEFPASRFDRDAWRIWMERRPMRGVQAMVDD